ncbi:TIGR00270 family protein [Candidatus Woesearchaeota archaeon]|nr:TIGR00270 family protein [Candidatus Woesearchaeota archaeon]
MICEMCGKNLDGKIVIKAKVEGTVLKVCENCSQYGTVIAQSLPSSAKPNSNISPKQAIKYSKEEIEEMVVEDYAARIKKARESNNIKQEDFAKQINEKESLIHKIETGHIEPNIKLARKIEKYLGIKIVEEIEFREHKTYSKPKGDDSLTIGDMIKIKKKD